MTATPEAARFARLSWALIEFKVMYYTPERVHRSRRDGLTIPDETYDRLELKYLELCRELGRPNTIVHKVHPGFEDLGPGMMEVDETRPAVQLILSGLATRQKEGDPLR